MIKTFPNGTIVEATAGQWSNGDIYYNVRSAMPGSAGFGSAGFISVPMGKLMKLLTELETADRQYDGREQKLLEADLLLCELGFVNQPGGSGGTVDRGD